MNERHPIFVLSDRIVDDYVALDPMVATYLGVPGHDHEWGDLSPDGHEQRRGLFTTALDQVRATPPADDRWAQLAVRVAVDLIETQLDRYEHGEHLRDVSHLASLFPTVRDVFDVMDTATADGWAAIAARLEGLDEVMRDYRACLEEGLRQGLVAPRRQVRSVIDQMRAAAEGDGRIARLPTELAASDVDDDGLADRVERATADACAAILDAADRIETDYLPHGLARDGFGVERYRRDARRYLGTDLDLEETYAWGWAHLAELRDRIAAVAREIAPDRDLDGVVELLKTDPARAVSSPEEFRAVVQDRLDRAVEDLDGPVFDIPDEIRRCEVRIAAPGTPPGAWYQSPSEDFSRPGSAWWSFPDRTHIPMYDAVSVAYHEGFPGHHLQIGLAMTISEKLSRLHRLMYWKPGYQEGWALYTERLMDELGYLGGAANVFGMLTESLLRAARVVIDIGCHLDLPIPADQPFHPGERWSFEHGVEMLERRAFLDRAFAESEVTRYLGWPAQAITYKVGQRTILQLRDEAARREGDGFDLKEFHHRVLGSGTLGLDLLREVVLDPR